MTDFYHGMQMDLRMAARASGDLFYSTGYPCKRGHIAKRYASTGGCVECVRPGAGQRALSRDQARVVTRVAFWALIPVATSDDDVVALKRYLATCMQQWEKSKGTPGGINNWSAKINGELPW